MADKGDVYYCCWHKNDEGDYIAWEKQHPSLRVQGKTPHEMMRLLGNVVGEYHDDHEAATDLDPPYSSTRGNDGLFTDGMVQIQWAKRFSIEPTADTAFALGRCKRCGRGRGPRTSISLIADIYDDDADGAFSSPSNAPPPQNMPGHLMIVSEAFLRLLTDVERAQFEARPVEWSSKRRLSFFELVPKTIVPSVAIKGREVDGWRCDVCGQRCFSHGTELGWGVDVISRLDLPSTQPSCFFVGDATDFGFCMSRERWIQLCGQPGTRKMMHENLGVIDEGECERQPRLPTLDEQAEMYRQRHSRVTYKRRAT
jgi:hypothetical protein